MRLAAACALGSVVVPKRSVALRFHRVVALSSQNFTASSCGAVGWTTRVAESLQAEATAATAISRSQWVHPDGGTLVRPVCQVFGIASESPNGALALLALYITSASRKTRHQDFELARDAREHHRDRIETIGGRAITDLAVDINAPTVGDRPFVTGETA